MKNLASKYGHLEGFSSLQFFPGSERKLVTCGSDHLVRIHRLEELDDEGDGIEEITHMECAINAIAVRRDGAVIVAGGEDGCVCSFDPATGEFLHNLKRFNLPVRDVVFSPVSTYAALASDNDDVHLVNSDDPKNQKVLEGHIGGVKALAFDPKGKYLASSGTDCTVRVWDVEAGNEIKCFNRVYSKTSAAGNTDGKPANMCKVAWSYDGKLLAVAGNSEVKIFARDTWEAKEPFVGSSPNREASVVQFSPNGLYLLVVDTGGLLIVYDVGERESITRFDNPSRILTAQWDPLMNSIAIIAEDGQYGIVMDVIPIHKLGPASMIHEDDDELEDAESFGVGGDEEDEDLGIVPARDEARRAAWDGPRRAVRYESDVERQEPFQPQSTPMEAKRRFLAYTYDGFITSRAESTLNLIEIEFADIEQHRPIRFNDYAGFTMAAMGTIGAVFASPESKEGNEITQSTVFYRPFDSWAANSDWTVSLRKGEAAAAVAIGNTFVAVATSTLMLRVFSFSGVQIHVFSLPSAIVCMSGQDDLLGFVHHNACSPSASGDQVLEFQLMDVKSKKLLARGPMCLSQGSKLEWFSVLSGAMLAALDSEGITTVYSPAAMGGQWCPVLDIKERNKARDWFWPIGIDEGHLNGVVCKIEKRYPDVIQPVVQRFALEVPLCRSDAGEEKWLRGSIFLAHDALQDEEHEDIASRSLALDKDLLQLINMACEQEKLMRALDLAMLIKSEKGLKASITLAQRHRLPTLAEKIDLYRQTKIAEEEAALAAAQQQQEEDAGYEEYVVEEEEEARHESPRAVKRARFAEHPTEVDSDEGQDEEQGHELETPPGPVGGVQRRTASIFAVKNTNEQGGLKEGVRFADRMKTIQQKQQEAARPKPMLGSLVGGFGAKGKGLGFGKGRKQKTST